MLMLGVNYNKPEDVILSINGVDVAVIRVVRVRSKESDRIRLGIQAVDTVKIRREHRDVCL